ncbi:MAG TPA: lysine-sensitive aspartokinase 3 [Vicinamibacterales bacterium]|nr:lysine-sensitive aspartokinase 3 [Vicinamibacterales bacterium]
MNVIMKFGGTSVADAEAMNRVINIVRAQWADNAAARPPVVVVSAMSKVTDRLIETARLAGERQGDRAVQMVDDLLARHLGVASTLVADAALDQLTAQLTADFAALAAEVRAWAEQGEVAPPAFDVIQAMGELASSRIVAAAFCQQGVSAAWIDSRRVLVTDAEHSAALPDMEATAERAKALIATETAAGRVPVLGGFIGATPTGVTTTLGRGGSDYSAAIFGACLDVDEIQIWTDVDGMLTADPRVVPTPVLVPELSFDEASELAYFGAKVLHPSTILPAVSKNIPVRILNSRRPEVRGTMITARGRGQGRSLTALACKRGVTVIDITSSRMLMAFGFLRRLFEVFERFKTPVDVVTTSEVSVSVTVDNTRRLDDIIRNLRNFAEVSTEPDMAIVCIVGENLRSDPTLFGRAVNALDKVPLRLVSQAGSRRNITFVLRDADVVTAMNLLHDQFFAEKVGV